MSDSISPILFNVLGNTEVKQQMLETLTTTTPSVNLDDINRGFKTRYFARYATQRDGTIYELTGTQYASIENNSLFLKTTINWIIKGPLQDTVLTLKDGTDILVKGVISKNKALVTIANNEVPGIVHYLQNYMEYWSGE
jgi:hypothetical protein